MKWFDKWIIQRYQKLANSPKEAVYAKSSVTSNDSSVDIEGLRFNVMAASGGTIVQLRSYDNRTDRNICRTHVIPDGEPIAERIGQIVSLEILRT